MKIEWTEGTRTVSRLKFNIGLPYLNAKVCESKFVSYFTKKQSSIKLISEYKAKNENANLYPER